MEKNNQQKELLEMAAEINLRQKINRLGLTQSNIADKSGFSESKISKIMNCEQGVLLDDIPRLLSAFDMIPIDRTELVSHYRASQELMQIKINKLDSQS